MTQDTNPLCPCGSGTRYTDCCAPLINRDAVAATAESLMRSRYTAYVMRNSDYLLHSWHPDYRPGSLDLEHDGVLRWLGLKIIATDRGKQHDQTGTVTFVARYKTAAGRAERLEECSRFERVEGRWVYCIALS